MLNMLYMYIFMYLFTGMYGCTFLCIYRYVWLKNSIDECINARD